MLSIHFFRKTCVYTRVLVSGFQRTAMSDILWCVRIRHLCLCQQIMGNHQQVNTGNMWAPLAITVSSCLIMTESLLQSKSGYLKQPYKFVSVSWMRKYWLKERRGGCNKFYELSWQIENFHLVMQLSLQIQRVTSKVHLDDSSGEAERLYLAIENRIQLDSLWYILKQKSKTENIMESGLATKPRA